MQTIDRESRERIRSPLDLDYMAKRYKTTNGYFTFTSPSLWTLEKNFFYLLKNSVRKTFQTKYKYKPDYLSFDEYGTPVLGQLLMFVNGVMCLEEFDLNLVIVPSMQSVVVVCRDKFPKQDPDDLDEVEW